MCHLLSNKKSWSSRKSLDLRLERPGLGLGLEPQSLGLGLEPQSLGLEQQGLGLGLDKKVLVTALSIITATYLSLSCCCARRSDRSLAFFIWMSVCIDVSIQCS